MTNPLVTVACITYNHGKYVRECLNGILKQKCSFEVEIIVHDDKSTDGTREIIEEYKNAYPNIILILQNENQYSKGKKPLIDFILPRAKGRYMAFCEGDDYWTDPNKLQNQADFLESNSDFSFCTHLVNRVDEDGGLLKVSELKGENIIFEKNQTLHQYFPPVSLMFRNLEIPYTQELKSVINGDAVLIGLLSLHGKAAILDFIGAVYRIHQSGVYSSKSYYKKQVSSIHTRRAMIRSGLFNESAKQALIAEIRTRKLKSVKELLKRFHLVELVKIVLA